MRETLTTNEIAHRLYQDKNAGWTWAGAQALAEYLESYEEDAGTELELDIVAIRCDYSEYSSAIIACDEMSNEKFEEEAAALEYLYRTTNVITFDGGIIVGAF